MLLENFSFCRMTSKEDVLHIVHKHSASEAVLLKKFTENGSNGFFTTYAHLHKHLTEGNQQKYIVAIEKLEQHLEQLMPLNSHGDLHVVIIGSLENLNTRDALCCSANLIWPLWK